MVSAELTFTAYVPRAPLPLGLSVLDLQPGLGWAWDPSWDRK